MLYSVIFQKANTNFILFKYQPVQQTTTKTVSKISIETTNNLNTCFFMALSQLKHIKNINDQLLTLLQFHRVKLLSMYLFASDVTLNHFQNSQS